MYMLHSITQPTQGVASGRVNSSKSSGSSIVVVAACPGEAAPDMKDQAPFHLHKQPPPQCRSSSKKHDAMVVIEVVTCCGNLPHMSDMSAHETTWAAVVGKRQMALRSNSDLPWCPQCLASVIMQAMRYDSAAR